MIAETFSTAGAIISLLLPWVFGSTLVHALLRTSARRNIFLVAGHGYLVGIFSTTLIIRLWSAVGLPLHFWSIAGFIAALSLIALISTRMKTVPDRELIKTTTPLPLWQLLLTALLLCLIVLRYTTIAQEIVLRPLFPWDAWMNWAPKAIVWFHHEDMVPFVSPQDWLAAPANALSYTEGAGKAWQYPITVPLVQLWGMLGMNTNDSTLIYLPWLFVALAMGSALYGQLRLSGASVLLATLACYTLLNLPFIGVHVALAGYADIWVAAAFGCAVFALHEWGKTRHWAYAGLALVLAFMCIQLKIPGLIMGGIVFVVFLSSILKLKKASWLILTGLALLLTVITLTIGIDFNVPGAGRMAVSSDGIVLPYIGRYDLQYHNIHKAMGKTLFFMLNWNMLWYAFFLLGGLWLVKNIKQGTSVYAPSLELRAILLTLLFIAFVYYFTNRYRYAQDFTQLNRALIYTIPVIVFYLYATIGEKISRFLLAQTKEDNEVAAEL